MGDLFEGWHLVILVLLVVVLFGYKKMPDAARSLGRSMRIFKSEMGEMKKDNTATSAASRETVKGQTVPPVTEPVQDPATDPAERGEHDQPSA
jgi:sec-independent protein translocase protein TatA